MFVHILPRSSSLSSFFLLHFLLQTDHGIAKGATCLGYSHFIQFIEPNTKTYCLRCCENKKDCPVEKSREGCKAAFGKSVKL